jgi:cell wall assembly regulator SMI1
VQKFTRALTREIELGGQRLKVTLNEKGLAFSLVGSRRPPREITWAALLQHLARGEGVPEPDPQALAEAVEQLKGASPGRKANKTSAQPSAQEARPAPAAAEAPGQQSESVPALLNRLETWLRSHRPRYVQGLLPGANAEELASLRAGLGGTLPEELRALLAWHNGQSGDLVGAFEDCWELMSATQIIAAKQDLDARGGGPGAWKPAWIPFLDDDAGSYLVLEPSQAGMPVREYRPDSTEAAVVAPSLIAWLRDFVAAVERGEYVEDTERGDFLRRGQ